MPFQVVTPFVSAVDTDRFCEPNGVSLDQPMMAGATPQRPGLGRIALPEPFRKLVGTVFHRETFDMDVSQATSGRGKDSLSRGYFHQPAVAATAGRSGKWIVRLVPRSRTCQVAGVAIQFGGVVNLAQRLAVDKDLAQGESLAIGCTFERRAKRIDTARSRTTSGPDFPDRLAAALSTLLPLGPPDLGPFDDDLVPRERPYRRSAARPVPPCAGLTRSRYTPAWHQDGVAGLSELRGTIDRLEWLRLGAGVVVDWPSRAGH